MDYPTPDCAIFADTGWEPQYVYEHLDWLESQLSYPLIRVSAGNIKKNLRNAVTVTGHRFVDVPFFLLNSDGSKGSVRRQCTTHYKINPIYKRLRLEAGGQPKRPLPKDKHVEVWLGITVDEAARMKPSRQPWATNRWPLIDLRWSRDDCLQWFNQEYPGRRLPRSACVICPYRSTLNWMEMKEHDPESFAEAVRFDNRLRNSRTNPIRKILRGRPYLHDTRRPLQTVIARMEQTKSEIDISGNYNPFNNECEGMCGV